MCTAHCIMFSNKWVKEQRSTPLEATSVPSGSHPNQSTKQPPTPPHINITVLPDPEWMLHSSRWPCFSYSVIYLFIFCFALKMLINWGGCRMHLHTYHINTDKAIGAKRARQTAAVNSQPDLRQSWMATEPGNKCIFHGRHVGAWGETNQYRKLMLIKYWLSCLEGNWF